MPTHSFFLERFPTPLGALLLVTDDEQRVRALDWDDHETRMTRLLIRHYGPCGWTITDRPSTSSARHSLEAYFAGDLAALHELVVETGGTSFQRTVWDMLRCIPVGSTTTYGELAASIGRRPAVRAVGLANASNPVSIVVPCHRVIGAGLSLTGYAGGLDRKRWLLAHEGVYFARRDRQIPRAISDSRETGRRWHGRGLSRP